jgi:hypothetical protein
LEEAMASGPAYLKAFKELANASLGEASFRTTEEEFYGESDRVAGILLATMTENALEAALKSVCRRDSSTLFGFNGPAGTFHAKIVLAYALSILGQKSRHDLDLLREVRNGLAHSRAPLRFDMPELRTVCEHLEIPETPAAIQISVRYETDRLKAQGIPPKNHAKYPRYLFAVTCHSLTHHLAAFSRRRHTVLQSPLP